MMGLVFKTSRAAARVLAGGFDSHVPPPLLDSASKVQIDEEMAQNGTAFSHR